MSTCAAEDEKQIAAKNSIERLSNIAVTDEPDRNDSISALGQQIGHRCYNRSGDIVGYAELLSGNYQSRDRREQSERN